MSCIHPLAARVRKLTTSPVMGIRWSHGQADKIFDSIEAAKQAVTNSLVDGAGAALDTLNELAAALGDDPNFATTIAGELNNRVRFRSDTDIDDRSEAAGMYQYRRG